MPSFQGFNGADLRNVCTEAGMSAIRAERDYVIHEDFMKVRCSYLKLHIKLLKVLKEFLMGVRVSLLYSTLGIIFGREHFCYCSFPIY